MKQLPKEITDFLKSNNMQTADSALIVLKFSFDALKSKIELASMIYDDNSNSSQAIKRMAETMKLFKP